MADNDPNLHDDAAVASDETLPALNTPSPARTPSGGSGRRPSGPATYQPGDLVAERYKIVKPIGEGGMGEVYESEDLLLKERVALKTLRHHVADDETTILRFKREIQLARRVTHPNVCRIFDVGIDRRSGREIAFLTMELLNGETLAARIRRKGPMSVEEAMPIATQIAGALAAAHAAGIIHRDLKCANVVLEDGASGGRAVVTDFGLARAATSEGDTVTGDGGIVGSPAYMAPEQVEGGRRLSGAADIYAFGVVLFEMVTGRLPFVGESPLATAVKRIKEPPPSPRLFVPSLDERWERGILHALGRTPEDRPATALDVVAELRGDSIVSSAPRAGLPLSTTTAVPRPARSRKKLAAVLVILVGGAGLMLSRRHRAQSAPAADATQEAEDPAGENDSETPPGVPRPPRLPVPPVPPVPDWRALKALEKLRIPRVVVRSGSGETFLVDPRRVARRGVAILGFKNLSGKKADDYLSTALSEMLSSELMAGDELRTIPGESVARARKQLELAPAESYAKDTLRRLREQLDADYVVTGSYLVMGEDRVRLDLKVQDTATGETLAAIPAAGDLDELNDLVDEVGEKMRETLHVEEPSESEHAAARALQPRKADVTRLFAEGLAQMRVENCGAARGPLEQAVALDPAYAQAHEALSDALYCLGYEGRALEEARTALELSRDLPDDVRLQAEARMQQLTNEPAKAAASYEALFERNRDNFDYGLRLMRAQMKSDRSKARATLATLKKLQPSGQNSAELALAEAQLAEGQPPEKQLALLERTRTLAEEQGARVLAATALLNESGIHIELGDLDKALSEVGRAKEVFQASGDKDGIILALSGEAAIKQRRGDDKAVEQLLAQATQLAEQIDSVRSLAGMKIRIGDVKAGRLDLTGAAALFDDAYRMLQRRGAWADAAFALMRLAGIMYERGELRQALAALERSAADLEDVKEPLAIGYTHFTLAMVQLSRGEVEESRKSIEAALRARPELAERGAGELYEGLFALVGNRPGDAEAHLRKSLELDQGGKLFLPGFLREGMLIDALLAQGKAADARDVLDKMREKAGKSISASAQLELDLTAARVRATSRKPADLLAAGRELSALSDKASKAGLFATRLRIDLARGRIERASDNAGLARVLLTGVSREAGRRGYAMLAKVAARTITEEDKGM